MKKSLVLLLCLCVLLCGCGSGAVAAKSTDELFLDAFKNGLTDRWDITLQASYNMNDAVNAELKHVRSFAGQTFEDEHLQKLAYDYIKAVEGQEEALAYETVDYVKCSTLFGKAYNKRTVLIKQICSEYNIQFADKYKEAYESIFQSAAAAEIELGMDEAIENLIDKATLKLEDGSRTWKSYSVTVKNESKYDIPNLQIQVQIYDSEHVAVDTCYCDSIKVLRAGESARVSFSTNKDFADYVLYASYYS